MSDNDKDCGVARNQEKAAGMSHGGQIHEQVEEHRHGHWHGQICPHGQLSDVDRGHWHEALSQRGHHQDHGHGHSHGEAPEAARSFDKHGQGDTLCLRSHSGVSGDMLLAGLSALNLQRLGLAPDGQDAQAWLNDLCAAIMPELGPCLSLRRRSVSGIAGWQAIVNLPRAHEHRNLDDVNKIIDDSSLSADAKKLASRCFSLIADAEADVHGVGVSEVHFHEVGALDSLLDICGCCELYQRLGAPFVASSPLPLADGQVMCAHGVLPAPAPATMELLHGVAVTPFSGDPCAGELITPTGVALLKTFNARFGPWPAFTARLSARVYGAREFATAPNGLLLALGERSF